MHPALWPKMQYALRSIIGPHRILRYGYNKIKLKIMNNICCTEENYEYHEVMYSNIKIHIKCVCKVCHSYIAFVKRDEVDEKLVKKLKTTPLY